MSKKTILKSIRGSNKYNFSFEELLDEETNQVIIESRMYIDLSSKAAKNKLNKAWAKDKSPLLLELQQIFREHEKDKKEDRANTWYDPIE